MQCDRCNMCDMADLNLRNVPDALLVELKKAAVKAGWTLKKLCVHRLSGKTYGEVRREAFPESLKEPSTKAKRPKMIMPLTPKAETPKTSEAPARPAHAETCRCGICQLRRK